MIRKGIVFILTNRINEALGYIISQIPDDIIYSFRKANNDWSILINDYEINIRNHINESARGYRPEIVYIMDDYDVNKDIYENVIEAKVCISVRKEPIRKIRFVESIDVGEFLYDEDAELIHCDKEKLNRWNDMINPKEINKEKFMQEYDCTFVGKDK
jgi:hypothetical protein